MTTIDLSTNAPSLGEILELAGKENVVLRTAEGREFVLAEIDDFDREIQLTRQNTELMALLAERSSETPRKTLAEVRKRLSGQP